MYADWGLSRLYERINHEMEEETQHADALLKRILFLEGTPDMTPEPINPGKTVPDMLRNDLALEYRVRAALAQGIAPPSSMATTRPATCCPAAARHRGRPRLLAEQQLGLIDRIGLQNYLQSQCQLSLSPREVGPFAGASTFRQSRKRLTIDCNWPPRRASSVLDAAVSSLAAAVCSDTSRTFTTLRLISSATALCLGGCGDLLVHRPMFDTVRVMLPSDALARRASSTPLSVRSRWYA